LIDIFSATINFSRMQSNEIIPLVKDIEQRIYTLRGFKVMLDTDLAELYGVTTKVFNQAIKRNEERFPLVFRFQITSEEFESIRSQIVTASGGSIRSQTVTASKRNIRYLPYAFSEHGALMAANVLRSERAIQVSIGIVEAFVRLREMALSYKELTSKINDLESKYDDQFKIVFEALRQLMTPPASPCKELGFHTAIKKPSKK